MSFGSPGGGATNIKPTPPERGSFPLDHEGECKHLISQYLKCLKLQGGVNNEECRKLAKGYLSCRMDKYVSLYKSPSGGYTGFSQSSMCDSMPLSRKPPEKDAG
ncbi:coiled-coil-helix-coiled-coil-helix domain-containing protein [Aspergillus clavatus NRRL 1]|uniref:CHCH domain protein n=1 Tax=Aspergillus clavatus (strain ATCC 1007 / CBS 513.65 / DSM 816 / NCTC 3887 / NRRL 1 / QM 1276 / 107) TaxID=344612 RepID=A1CQD7_ASPCL|nr:CHCH domain protein [Aspergillus clavatus NRRL 1]EAW07858.1 CHCH domain protein [Aspergillus clavatus NRRL 1]